MSRLELLKEKVREILPQVDYVIGYRQGFDSIHTTPFFVREESDIEKLVWNEFCIHNLTVYLPPQVRGNQGLFNPGEKIGIMVKGCDSRAIIELLQEEIIRRNDLIILGLPCTGQMDERKLREKIDIDRLQEGEISQNVLKLATDIKEITLKIEEVLYDKCLSCPYPNPLIYDYLIGEKVSEESEESKKSNNLGEILYGENQLELENLSLEERFKYWEEELTRCIRCYACRDICPTCYCQFQCIAQTRVPHWVSQEVGLKEKKFFQFFRAIHNAGRCIDCWECQRVCPMDIPVYKMVRKLNQEIFNLFDYVSGVDSEVKPPLLTFKKEEDKL